jgi:antirestriction protein ArdC
MSRHDRNARAGQGRVSLYSEITDKIIAELEAGPVPWVPPSSFPVESNGR